MLPPEAHAQAGPPAGEPAAIVQWATTRDQREVAGTLSDLPALALAASIGPPATLVVRPVAALADELAAARASDLTKAAGIPNS